METRPNLGLFCFYMKGFILGKKITQIQGFTEGEKRIPITVIDSNECYLVDVKIPSISGYFAVKLGIGWKKTIKKPVQGELEKAGIKTPLAFLKEIRLEDYQDKIKVIEENNKKGIIVNEKKIFIGEKVDPSIFFQKGEKVDVSGISKGKGFQGVVGRHNFAGGPRTHGQSDRERAPGSIGQTTTPGRVYKGKRMAGHAGMRRVTIRNLSIFKIEGNKIYLKGLVPGKTGQWLEIKSSLS